MASDKATKVAEITVEEKLKALFELQSVHSKVDKIKTLRGELPLEVQDLEDEIEGLATRLSKLEDEIEELTKAISGKKNEIDHSNSLILKYKEQQNNVRNNREYDSLSKEIEFQTLEIELSEKKIKEFTFLSNDKKIILEESKTLLEERTHDLNNKKNELQEITGETEKEELGLQQEADKIAEVIEERLITAYSRIRSNARNGLAVVSIERDACGGCFNQIPPQRQLDIASHKKIIVCEYCGRILIDKEMAGIAE